jgi:hypothetical protein
MVDAHCESKSFLKKMKNPHKLLACRGLRGRWVG